MNADEQRKLIEAALWAAREYGLKHPEALFFALERIGHLLMVQGEVVMDEKPDVVFDRSHAEAIAVAIEGDRDLLDRVCLNVIGYVAHGIKPERWSA